MQYHIAFSKTVRSVGVLAGGPYWCAEDQLATAEHACMVAPSNIDVKELKFFTKQAEKVYSIDPTSNLNGTKVFVLSGTLDTVVVPGCVRLHFLFPLSFLFFPFFSGVSFLG